MDNARALVLAHDAETRCVTFNPKLLAFVRHWGFGPKACAPYRARTKGKTENGVGYVKKNAVAGRSFKSFEEFEAHLAAWESDVANARDDGRGVGCALCKRRGGQAEAAGRPPCVWLLPRARTQGRQRLRGGGGRQQLFCAVASGWRLRLRLAKFACGTERRRSPCTGLWKASGQRVLDPAHLAGGAGAGGRSTPHFGTSNLKHEHSNFPDNNLNSEQPHAISTVDLVGLLMLSESELRSASQLTTIFRHNEMFSMLPLVLGKNIVVRWPGGSVELPVSSESDVLDALLARGNPIVHSCRRGNCGQCAVRVLESEQLEHPVGSAVQLCRLPALSAGVYELDYDPYEVAGAARTYPAKVLDLTEVARGVVRLRVRTPPNRTIEFKGGQYAFLILKTGLSRSYSIANVDAATNQVDFYI